MNDVVDLTAIRAARRDFTLEDRVRAQRARAAAAKEAIRRQAEIRDRARIAVAAVLREPVDPTSVA